MKKKEIGKFNHNRIQSMHDDLDAKMKKFCAKNKVGISTFLETLGLLMPTYQKMIKTNTVPMYMFVQIYTAIGYELEVKRSDGEIPFLKSIQYVDSYIEAKKKKNKIKQLSRYGKTTKKRIVRIKTKNRVTPERLERRISRYPNPHGSDALDFLATH